MYALSIDSGGTKIACAVINDSGEILAQERFDDIERDGNYLIAKYIELVSTFREDYQISVVGISCNGRIDPIRGIILDSGVHRNWQGRHVKTEVEKAVSLPVRVSNDCISAVKGEMWLGSAQEFNTIVGIIIGTGLGGAIVAGNEFWTGAAYGAGEIGHMILHQNGLPCYCGQKGCVERYVSGTALWTRYNYLVGANRIDSGYEFFSLLSNGDARANQVMKDFINDLSTVMVSVTNLCDPEVILIGGGISETHEVWGKALEERYMEQLGTGLQDKHVIYASTGNSAALLGVAKFGFEMLQSRDAQDTRR